MKILKTILQVLALFVLINGGLLVSGYVIQYVLSHIVQFIWDLSKTGQTVVLAMVIFSPVTLLAIGAYLRGKKK